MARRVTWRWCGYNPPASDNGRCVERPWRCAGIARWSGLCAPNYSFTPRCFRSNDERRGARRRFMGEMHDAFGIRRTYDLGDVILVMGGRGIL